MPLDIPAKLDQARVGRGAAKEAVQLAFSDDERLVCGLIIKADVPTGVVPFPGWWSRLAAFQDKAAVSPAKVCKALPPSTDIAWEHAPYQAFGMIGLRGRKGELLFLVVMSNPFGRKELTNAEMKEVSTHLSALRDLIWAGGQREEEGLAQKAEELPRAEQRGSALRMERRRPGRIEKVSLELIPLLRETAQPMPEQLAPSVVHQDDLATT